MPYPFKHFCEYGMSYSYMGPSLYSSQSFSRSTSRYLAGPLELIDMPLMIDRIAIAIFKIHSAEIFATDSASNFYVLLTNLTSHLYSADKLLKVSAYNLFPFLAPVSCLPAYTDNLRAWTPSGCNRLRLKNSSSSSVKTLKADD